MTGALTSRPGGAALGRRRLIGIAEVNFYHRSQRTVEFTLIVMIV